MVTWSVKKFWIRAVARWGIMWKTLNVELLQTCFVIEDFGSNRTSIAIGNAWRLLVLKVRRDFILDGLLVQNVANIQSVNAFIGEFDIQKRAVPCFCRFTDPNSFEKPVWRKSKTIPWSRCPGDPTSAKCKVKVDSYKACGRFNGREYSFVRIWWRPNCKLTNGKSPSNETSCMSGLLYFLEPWLRCLLLVLSNRFKTFTDWHPGLVRFPMLSMWSLQPYGAVVPSCRIQCSSRFIRKGVLKLGLFVGWYIFSNIRTFMDRIEWSGRLKCR